MNEKKHACFLWNLGEFRPEKHKIILWNSASPGILLCKVLPLTILFRHSPDTWIWTAEAHPPAWGGGVSAPSALLPHQVGYSFSYPFLGQLLKSARNLSQQEKIHCKGSTHCLTHSWKCCSCSQESAREAVVPATGQHVPCTLPLAGSNRDKDFLLPSEHPNHQIEGFFPPSLSLWSCEENWLDCPKWGEALGSHLCYKTCFSNFSRGFCSSRNLFGVTGKVWLCHMTKQWLFTLTSAVCTPARNAIPVLSAKA